MTITGQKQLSLCPTGERAAIFTELFSEEASVYFFKGR